jgi:hypothetical protein
MNSSKPKKRNSKKDLQKNETASDDPRFAHVRKDPRFVRPKKKDVKITLDDRFAHMLTSKEFSDACKS